VGQFWQVGILERTIITFMSNYNMMAARRSIFVLSFCL